MTVPGILLSAVVNLPTATPLEGLFDPWIIVICCAVAALGVALTLPRRSSFGPVRTKIGGIVILVALVVLVGNLLVGTIDRLGGASFWGFGAMGAYFWVFAILAVGASVRVITHQKPVYSALWFVLTIFASAGLFILLFAEFMAMALVTIYAGAILVTYTFVIMLASDAGPERSAVDAEGAVKEYIPDHDANARDRWSSAAIGFLMAGVLLFAVFNRAPEVLPRQGRLAHLPYTALLEGTGDPATTVGAVPLDQADVVSGATQRLGVYLLGNQLVALQVAGLVLTVAMIGAIVIARRPIFTPASEREIEMKSTAGRMISTPSTPIDDNPNSLPVHGTTNPRQKAYPQT